VRGCFPALVALSPGQPLHLFLLRNFSLGEMLFSSIDRAQIVSRRKLLLILLITSTQIRMSLLFCNGDIGRYHLLSGQWRFVVSNRGNHYVPSQRIILYPMKLSGVLFVQLVAPK